MSAGDEAQIEEGFSNILIICLILRFDYADNEA